MHAHQSRLCRGPIRLSVLSLIAIATLAFGQSAEAKGKARISFAGLQSATTCVGGPIGGGRTTSYHLSWQPASERSPRARIVYEIYQATTPGGENLSAPAYTTAPGVTSFQTPALPTEQDFFFVVRARDRAGREDSNKVEREGQNLCL